MAQQKGKCMGLLLLKDRDGRYRRTWYAIVNVNGKRTSRVLKTPLHGKIPLDENGNFSLALTGDEKFEASKAAARQELMTKNSDRRQSQATSRRHAEDLGIQRIRIADLARTNAKRKKYALVDTGDAAADKRTNKYNQSVFDILIHFSKWTEKHASKPSGKTYGLITDIDRDLVTAYYADLAKSFSWQTFRKYVFILKSVFAHFTNDSLENHFAEVYDEEYKGRKSAISDKSEIAHKPPTDEQMSRVWDYTRNLRDKPYLHRLAVLAACSGLRIGDCCNLTWDKVDLLKMLLTVKTEKTKAEVAIPLFDYDPSAKDYHPVFGELRRELEAALVERKDNERYVIPEAARIYSYNPTRINKEGKSVFAHALFAEPQPENAILADEAAPTPKDILKAIDSAPFAPTKKERVRQVYELHVTGKSYSQIAAIIGRTKAAISEDLASVEDLTGAKIRKGNMCTSPQRLTTLLKETRAARAQGVRSACLYGWHSCRMYFVVTARRAGIDPETLKKITGHATVRMVEHYNNADTVEAANTMRRQMSAKHRKQTKPTSSDLASAIQAILASTDLTAKAKNAAILALSNKPMLPDN